MKPKLLFLLAVIFLVGTVHSQGLDQNLKLAATDIAQKIIKKNKTQIAVADFVNNVGKSDALTQYVTEQFEMGLINAPGEVQIMDRKHIKQLLLDNHLQSEGLIDEARARSAISFIKVDGWALGEITSFGDQIKISVKVIDVSTSLIYAAYTTDLISDPTIKKIIQSAIDQNIPVNKDCLEKNTGDYCFKNLTNKKILVCTAIYGPVFDVRLSLDPGQTQCIYDAKAGVHPYSFIVQAEDICYGQGQFKVEQCQSTTFEIK